MGVWLDAVHDIPGTPRRAYWDGGITDYHLHLDCAQMQQGLVLHPHFKAKVVPGWLDKSLPNAKLPERSDFKAYGDDFTRRERAWTRAI